MLVVPGASGRVGGPGEAPEEEAGFGEPTRDEFTPVLLGRTLTIELPALLEELFSHERRGTVWRAPLVAVGPVTVAASIFPPTLGRPFGVA
ncbi:hypothetical protein [Streptomyces anatolicus]|uniref:hypothetical protein n=1 Tax=Streptomyces anatolicus TaxID=2675858 RepID=UPI001CA47679|nr:hypothetical protein [Streptomyces anatolicus]